MNWGQAASQLLSGVKLLLSESNLLGLSAISSSCSCFILYVCVFASHCATERSWLIFVIHDDAIVTLPIYYTKNHSSGAYCCNHDQSMICCLREGEREREKKKVMFAIKNQLFVLIGWSIVIILIHYLKVLYKSICFCTRWLYFV